MDNAKTNRFNQCLKKALLSPVRQTSGTVINDSIDFSQPTTSQARFMQKNESNAAKLPNILLQSTGSEFLYMEDDQEELLNPTV